MFAHCTESESAVVFALYMRESCYNSYNCFVDYDKRKHNNYVPFGQPQPRGSYQYVAFNIKPIWCEIDSHLYYCSKVRVGIIYKCFLNELILTKVAFIWL